MISDVEAELKMLVKHKRHFAYCAANFGLKGEDDLYTIIDGSTGKHLSGDFSSVLEAWDDALGKLREEEHAV